MLLFKVLLGTSCILVIVHLSKQLRAEIKWKSIAISSLEGNTIKMLPKYAELEPILNNNPYFLYNYGAELSNGGRYNESIKVLLKCRKKFNDYDLQILFANNYHELGEINEAIALYEHASNMIPNRFLPLYKLFKIYKDRNQKNEALKYANILLKKKVKIPSSIISSMKLRAENYVNKEIY